MKNFLSRKLLVLIVLLLAIGGALVFYIKTKEWTRLDPGIVEHKVFCPEIGFTQSTTVQGGNDFSQLISIKEL